MIGIGMEQDFKRDGLVSQILRQMGQAEKDIRGLKSKTNKPLWLPFGAYIGNNPFLAAGVPYSATIDRNIDLIMWTVAYFIVAPNDAVNYWKFDLNRADGFNIATFNSSADPAGTLLLQAVTSFSITSMDSSMIGMTVGVTPINAPGQLLILCPLLQIGAV